MINWDKSQDIVRLLEVIKEDSRRDTLRVLLKSEGFYLTKAVPSECLFNLCKLSEFIRLYTVEIK